VKSEVRIAVGDLVLVREEDAPEESTRNGAVLTQIFRFLLCL